MIIRASKRIEKRKLLKTTAVLNVEDLGRIANVETTGVENVERLHFLVPTMIVI